MTIRRPPLGRSTTSFHVLLAAASLAAMLAPTRVDAQTPVSGVKWDTLTLDFQGDAVYGESQGRANPSAAGGGVNPFLDRELEVTFTHAGTGTQFIVPGFFDGDGSGGGSGDVFRARFTPDQTGQWTYAATFKAGTNVAIGDVAGTGVTGGDFTGGQAAGGFQVADVPVGARGFHTQGRLLYNTGGDTLAQHYLRFQNGDYFLKGGSDSPENFLGYKGFDNTQTKGSGPGNEGVLHTYSPHAGDFNNDGPTWNNPDFNIDGTSGGNDAANIAGAVNYLASQHVNSIYFLPMNIGGDGKDTHPFANVSTTAQLSGNSGNDNAHYDISKLTQWEQFFSHAQDKGLLLHVTLNEAESLNKRELDNATLGPERKLFYREMIARFGHHNALQWNISEEYNRDLNLGETRVKDFAEYISELDPYDHPLTVHNGNFGNFNGPSSVGQRNEVEPFLGDDDFDLTSYQNYDQRGIGDEVEYFRARSRLKGRPIPIMIDEPESLDSSEFGGNQAARFDNIRKEMIWDIYLSGGSVEWFVRNKDQSLENFREFEQVWNDTFFARDFLQQNTPFWEMDSIILTPNTTTTPDDDYISADTLIRGADTDFGGAELFYKDGEIYAIYLPDGSNDDNDFDANDNAAPELDLRDHAGLSFLGRWYNPRTGLFSDESTNFTLLGGDWASLGQTPDGFQNTNDWAALVTLVPEPGSMALLLPLLALLPGRRR